jgi:hypothetical protein
MAEAETKPQGAWDLAKSLNQAICVRIMGPMYGVYYPYRKTGDLYVAIEDHPIRCCQCDADIPVDKGLKAWRQHIRDHSRRKLVNPIIFAGRDNEGELHVAQEKTVE